MYENEYLVSYGRSGDFGRFVAGTSAHLSRGDRVIIELTTGPEVGTVLCAVSEGHARFLSQTAVGKILRTYGPDDDRALERLRARSQQVFEHARQLVEKLQLPLE